MPSTENIGLTSRQVQTFIDDGFIKIERAFSTDLANRCRDELWAEIGLSPDAPGSWIHPVIRVGTKASPPFIEAANTPLLSEVKAITHASIATGQVQAVAFGAQDAGTDAIKRNRGQARSARTQGGGQDEDFEESASRSRRFSNNLGGDT